MIHPDQLASFLDDALDAGSRASLETELENDAPALRFVIEQRRMDRALRSLLGNPAQRQRLKESIRAAVAGSSTQKLRAQVLADTSGHPVQPRGAASVSPTWLSRLRTRFSDFLQPFQSRGLAWSAGVAVVLLLAVGLFFHFRPAPMARLVIGQFAVVVGQPTMQHSGKSSTLNAQPSTTIYLGDRIETGDADKAELVFNEGTTLRLGFNTAIEFPTLNSQPSTLNSPPLRPPEINLLRGQVWTKVQKSTNAAQYAIRTAAATAVARGTEFGVALKRPSTLNPQPSTPFAVLTVKEGAVDFSNALGSVQATAMTESTATPDSAPSQPVRLQTIKTFGLAPGKQVTVGPEATVLRFDEAMVYPYGWAGFDLRTIQIQGDGVAGARQLRVVRVRPGSPADQAGMAVGDLVTRVNGRPVTNIEEVLRPVIQRPGASVELGIARGEHSHTVFLETTRNPYSLPLTDLPADLAARVLDTTWSLIEAACEDVISSNRWQELERMFSKVVDDYPQVAALHNNFAVWYDMAHRPGPAIRQLRLAVEQHPDNPLYHYNLSDMLCGIGNFDRGVEEAEAVFKLAPDWVPGIIQLAFAYSCLDRNDDALAVLERGLSRDPSSADLWCAKTFFLSASQKQEEAVSAALKAIELEPSYSHSWDLLAMARWARGDLAESEAANRKAIEINPNNANAHNSLAIDIISRLGNRVPEDVTDALPEEMALERWRERPAVEHAIIAEAEHHARRAIELSKSLVTAYVNLGNILLTRGAVDDAETILHKAMEMDPGAQTAANACNGLAYRFAQWGIRLDEALQLAQQAVEMHPVGYIFDTLAVVHFRRGEWVEAEEAWKKCIELAGPAGDPGAWFHLGKVYERKSQPDAAITAYEQALKLRPDFPEAARALSQIRK